MTETQLLKTDYLALLDSSAEAEIERLTAQHEVIKDAMGKKFLEMASQLPPGPLKILDSACADGLVLRELVSMYPKGSGNTYTGTDINPVFFPAEPHPSISYVVQDINKPWPNEWRRYFDVVHSRLGLVPAGPAIQTAVNNLVQLVKPGGWVQLMEWAGVGDNTANGPAMTQYMNVVAISFEAFGVGSKLGDQFKPWLEEAGFVDVQEELVGLKIGAQNKNPELGEKGAWSTTQSCIGLARFVKGAKNAKLPFPIEELDTLPPRLETELKERGGTFALKVVWGRRGDL